MLARGPLSYLHVDYCLHVALYLHHTCSVGTWTLSRGTCPTSTCPASAWTLMLPARAVLPTRRYISPPHVFCGHVDPK